MVDVKRRYLREALRPNLRERADHRDARWVMSFRPIRRDAQIAAQLMRATRGGPLPSRWTLWRQTRIKSLNMQFAACAAVGAHSFLSGRSKRSVEQLQSALEHPGAQEALMVTACVQLHLSRLSAVDDPRAGEVALAAANSYFQAEEVADPIRIALTFAPGFRALYPERDDLDAPLDAGA